MVDKLLPIESRPRPLRVLMMDFNSYFASCEQQEQPHLRGKPVAVVPVESDTSFVIAASYEAKRFGVKTGTGVGDARRMCPGLQIVHARHPLYAYYHQRIITAAERVLPVHKIGSIDEMSFRLLLSESSPADALALAHEMKRVLRAEVGECIACSIGIAPNWFLAKQATKLQKPDGLVILTADDLPHRLHVLKLTDLTGINRRMAVRLQSCGVCTTEALCALDRRSLRVAFGSVIGERWWWLLRGYELPEPEIEPPRKTMSHSHVLAPKYRNDKSCREVLIRLLEKASARLRKANLWTGHLHVYVKGLERSWEAQHRLPPTQDSLTLNEALNILWPGRTFVHPIQVGAIFSDLKDHLTVTPSLFQDTRPRAELMGAIDDTNQRFGKQKIYLADLHEARDSVPERIAFDKTSLFSEGAGDNEWINPFRGTRV